MSNKLVVSQLSYRTAWILFLIFCVHKLSGQEIDFKKINYTIEDGLPSNECHRVLQDEEGYIWIATDRGLVRYDGYEFRTYGIKEGLLDLSCLKMMFDKDGKLWVLTLSGQIFISNLGRDHFVLYKYQQVLDPYLDQLKIMDFYIDSSMTLTCAVEGIGFVIIDSFGGHKADRGTHKIDAAKIFTKTVENTLLVSSVTRGLAPEHTPVKLRKVNIANAIRDATEIVYKDNAPLEFPYELLWTSIQNCNYLDHNNDMERSVLSLGGAGLFYENSKCIKIRSTSILDVIPYGEHYVSGEIHNKGVKFYRNFANLAEDKYYKLIPDISATNILRDDKGDLWITTLTDGLFYLRNQDITNLNPKGVSSSNINYISSGPKGLYFAENKTKLYHLDDNYVAHELIHDSESEIRVLTYFVDQKELLINKRQSCRITSAHQQLPVYYDYGESRLGQYGSNIAIRMDEDDFILAGSGNFLQFRNLDSLQVYNSDQIENELRVLCGVKLEDEDYLLGTSNGLISFHDKKIETLIDCPKQLQVRINDIVKLEDRYLFATQGYGLVFWDLRNAVSILDKSKGLLSDNLEDLFLDSKNNVFVSSNAGLSKLRYDVNDSLIIKNYTTFHGLPSNEVNNVAEQKDTIYIATSNGIGVLAGEPKIADRQLIKIDSCIANGEAISNKQKLSHSENNIHIEYKTLDYKMQSKIPYRYRLNEDAWTQTFANSTNFSALKPGSYTFQVQSQNIDGIWSDSATWDLNIAYPWWRTKTFYLLAFLAFSGIGVAIYNYRTRQLKDQLKVESEIRDLERSALQAQMNPHFIFNCLNSIQRYIMDNDKEQAMDYLSMFAKLIRQSLIASTKNKITLSDEISMLRSYLDLEKLRFKNKFDFVISLADNVVPEELMLPPLLVQPYVENAVIHGMKNKERAGLIEISFQKTEDNHLEIIVRDNGTAVLQPSTKQHKSLGISITSQRLAYNNKNTDKSLRIIPVHTENGTTVNIKVKL